MSENIDNERLEAKRSPYESQSLVYMIVTMCAIRSYSTFSLWQFSQK